MQHVHTCSMYFYVTIYDNYEMDRWKMFNRGADFFFPTPGRKMLVAGQDVKKRKNPKSRPAELWTRCW